MRWHFGGDDAFVKLIARLGIWFDGNDHSHSWKINKEAFLQLQEHIYEHHTDRKEVDGSEVEL